MNHPSRSPAAVNVSIEQALEMVIGLGFDEDQIISAAASRKSMRSDGSHSASLLYNVTMAGFAHPSFVGLQ